MQKVQIRSLARAADILSDPSKYDPHTKETADHSLPYVIAAASRTAGHAGAVRDEEDHGSDDPGATEESGSRGRSGDRESLPGTAAGDRESITTTMGGRSRSNWIIPRAIHGIR